MILPCWEVLTLKYKHWFVCYIFFGSSQYYRINFFCFHAVNCCWYSLKFHFLFLYIHIQILSFYLTIYYKKYVYKVFITFYSVQSIKVYFWNIKESVPFFIAGEVTSRKCLRMGKKRKTWNWKTWIRKG